MNFKIIITETLEKVIDVESGNIEDAISIAIKMYDSQAVELNYLDVTDVKFNDLDKMKTDKIFKIIFNKNNQGQRFEFKALEEDRTILIATDLLNDEDVYLYYEDGEFSDEEGNYLFDANELMKFKTFKELNTCECGGIGYIEEFIECGKPSSECCGGCTRDIECECILPFPL